MATVEEQVLVEVAKQCEENSATPTTTTKAKPKRKDPEELRQKKEEMVKNRMFRTFYTKTGISIYQCTECEFRTEFNTGIRDHVNKEHVKKVLACTECEYKTYLSKSLNSHRRAIHGISAMKCPAERCSFKSITLDQMQNHVNNKHPELKGQDLEFHAEVNPPARRSGNAKTVGVGKGNGRKGPYKKSIDPVSGKPIYTCKHCPYVSRSTMQLISHQNAQHYKRPITCTECNYSTMHYGTFYTHCRAVHKMSKRDCIVPGCKFKWLRDEAIQMHLWRKHAAVYDEKEHAIKVFA